MNILILNKRGKKNKKNVNRSENLACRSHVIEFSPGPSLQYVESHIHSLFNIIFFNRLHQIAAVSSIDNNLKTCSPNDPASTS